MICDIPYKAQNIILEEIDKIRADFKKTNTLMFYQYIEPICNNYIGIFPILYKDWINELQMKSYLYKDKEVNYLFDFIKSSDLKEFYLIGIKYNIYGDISLGFIEKIK